MSVVACEIPVDLDAEQSVLGACLLDRDAIVSAAAILRADDFYLEKHAQVFRALVESYERRVPPDIRTIADQLRRQSQLDNLGGVPYLVELTLATPTAIHVEHHAEIVRRCALLRRLIQAGGKIAALGYNQEAEIEETLARAEEALLAVAGQRRDKDFVGMDQVADEYFEQLRRYQERPGEMAGLATGYAELDALLGGGMQPGDMIMTAARPGVGKTAFVLNVSRHAACAGKHVGIFSVEMPRTALFQRWVAMSSGISSDRQRGRLSDAEYARVTQALGPLSKLAISIDDSSGITVQEMRMKALRLHRQRPLDLLIVDYLQLVQALGRRQGNREQEVAEISRGLKDIARRLNVPLLALAQFNREAELGPPQLRHLRESGALEQDSDVVFALWRPDREEEEASGAAICRVELVILKHRNGPTGAVDFHFNRETQLLSLPERCRAPFG